MWPLLRSRGEERWAGKLPLPVSYIGHLSSQKERKYISSSKICPLQVFQQQWLAGEWFLHAALLWGQQSRGGLTKCCKAHLFLFSKFSRGNHWRYFTYGQFFVSAVGFLESGLRPSVWRHVLYLNEHIHVNFFCKDPLYHPAWSPVSYTAFGHGLGFQRIYSSNFSRYLKMKRHKPLGSTQDFSWVAFCG